MPIIAIRSWTRSLQSTGKRVFRDGTHTHNSLLETGSAQRANSVKMKNKKIKNKKMN